MFFGNPAWMFLLTAAAADAGATNISVSVGSYLSVEASSLIFKDPSCSDSAFISFALLELVLVPCSLHYMCFVSQQVTLSSIVHIHLSCKVSLSTLYQI